MSTFERLLAIASGYPYESYSSSSGAHGDHKALELEGKPISERNTKSPLTLSGL